MGNVRYPKKPRESKARERGMRYPKEHKEQARQRLVERSGRLAKERGFAASGIDAMAAASGVTSGALYKHFCGKSDLFAAIVKAELQRSAQRFAGVAEGDANSLEKALDTYLSLQHADHPERGCVLPSLTAEVARADESVRAVFQAGLLDIHEVLKPLAKSGDQAWALIAQCVGAVMLARAVLDDDVRSDVLSAAKQSGRALLKQGPRRGTMR
jgi:TetR/AcrR family transcriptional regulator, transcriptional repressor for nem operon